jgi:5-methylcytosine-specific restriction endonuclease McrA
MNKDLGYMQSKKRKKVTEAQKEQYKRYLNSPKWRQKREDALEFHGRACGLCGGQQNLEVHHLTYINLYKETMADLRIVCRSCHHRIHKQRPSRKKISSEIDVATYYPNRKVL